jgi:hypothetical protein|tara:strand:- start:608 stop:820 length:213 start_codon:yes stop_codon:yes gene_type:complete
MAKFTEKNWVLILYNSGKMVAWRDYGDMAWGSAIYEVLGYYQGSHKDALKYGKNKINLKGNDNENEDKKF